MIGKKVKYQALNKEVTGEVVGRFNDLYWYVKSENGVVPVHIDSLEVMNNAKNS